MKFDAYTIISFAVILATILGIRLLSSPRTAVTGNRLGAIAMATAIVTVLIHNSIIGLPVVIISLAIGGIIGTIMALRVSMIRIPQMVALLNGLGGCASLLVAIAVILDGFSGMDMFNRVSGQLAVIVGAITLSGSLVAAGKLDKRLPQHPINLPGHTVITLLALAGLCTLTIAQPHLTGSPAFIACIITALISLTFGVLITIRIGGADMPVAISLLNSYSGLAASICGFALSDPLLIAIGAIVGASGLILTRIMCRAMNRSLFDVITGSTFSPPAAISHNASSETPAPTTAQSNEKTKTPSDVAEILASARKIIIIPGYGMALAQAQDRVKKLYELCCKRGIDVKFAIHPVAGRMPGHMNVLLAEVDIPYENLFEMDDINPLFADTDAAIIVGACDVVNPAAITMEGTPIYGMPVLHVHEARHVIVCNLDTRPGYSGVENPLYNEVNTIMMLGNAAETLDHITEELARK